MENERRRILKLVENGTISAEEAIVLLEALSTQKESTQSNTVFIPATKESESEKNTSYTTNEKENERKSKSGFDDVFGKMFNDKDTNKKMNEFINDLKQDLSHFSHNLMDLMNTTFTKVKEFDFEFPFGEKVEFRKSYEFQADEVRAIEIDLPSGKLDLVKGEEEKIVVEADVKTSLVDHDEGKTKEEFEQQFIKINEGKLEIATSTKMAQVSLKLIVPEKQYEVIILRLLNGGVNISNIDTKILKVKTYNGAVKAGNLTFNTATINGGNGSIDLRSVKGDDLEAETVNGRIYIDGEIQEIEAESVNGAVVVTSQSQSARKIKASTIAGAVELYVPKTVSLDGQVTTNFGKTDVGLPDIITNKEEEQFLQKTIRFNKVVENAPVLKLLGESRTGSIIVRYTVVPEQTI